MTSHRLVDVLEGGDRRFEIARVGEAVRADRAELGQAERSAVILGDIAARLAIDLDAELHAARDQADAARRNVHPAQLGEQAQRARLRDDQQLAVGIDEHAVGPSTRSAR